MATDDATLAVDPPVPDAPGGGAATIIDDRVVLARTVECWAGPITVLVSTPYTADRVDVESAAYSASNEVAGLVALATDDQEAGDDD